MSKHNQRLAIVGIFAVFLLPVTLALLLRVNAVSLNTVNFGELLEPPRELSAQGLTLDHALAPQQPLFEDVWTVLILAPEGCAQACISVLDGTRQARTAVNKDYDRVLRLLVTPAPLTRNVREELLDNHPDLALAHAKPAWMRSINALKAPVPSVWLIDPRSFQFMSYPAPLEAGYLLKDLKRLLKISKVG
ncbi:MAG: hypothetical protein AAF458_12330 [Pseudomonadota bacterium]